MPEEKTHQFRELCYSKAVTKCSTLCMRMALRQEVWVMLFGTRSGLGILSYEQMANVSYQDT